MLGHYESFPEIVHGVAQLSYKTSPKKVQQALVIVFYQLNQEKGKLREMGYSFPADCEANFEFGVGDEATFTFLDKIELSRLEREIESSVLTFLDFLCALQYHVVDESGRRMPLKFDYYLLRFMFDKNFVEFLVSHERGPQRVHVEDLIGFLVGRIEKELDRRFSAALKLEGVRTI